MASKPANSPCEPAFGCNETASYPVTSVSQEESCEINLLKPATCSTGAYGCNCENSGQVTGIISAVAFNFIVQDPSGIIVRSSAKSRSARLRI